MVRKEEGKSVSFPDGKNLADERQKALLMKSYEPPKTKRTRVETESGFCGSVVKDDTSRTETPTISINPQDIGSTTFYGDGYDSSTGGTFNSDGWDY